MQSLIYKLFITKINEGSTEERFHVSKSYGAEWRDELSYINHTIISDTTTEGVLFYHNLLTLDYFSKIHKLV